MREITIVAHRTLAGDVHKQVSVGGASRPRDKKTSVITPIDVSALEETFAELEHTNGPMLAWTWLACTVSRALAATQTAIIAGQREMLRNPGPLVRARARLEDIAALHLFVRRLRALHRAIGSRHRAANDPADAGTR